MCYIDFLILFAHTESKCHLILDYQFSFLKPGNSGANFLKFVTTYAEKVFDNLVIDIGKILDELNLIAAVLKVACCFIISGY